jgi:hypothetical protein
VVCDGKVLEPQRLGHAGNVYWITMKEGPEGKTNSELSQGPSFLRK